MKNQHITLCFLLFAIGCGSSAKDKKARMERATLCETLVNILELDVEVMERPPLDPLAPIGPVGPVGKRSIFMDAGMTLCTGDERVSGPRLQEFIESEDPVRRRAIVAELRAAVREHEGD